MIATKCYEILNSIDGRTKLNFRPARVQSTANPVLHNLVITWDIIMQDYRNVSMEECIVIQQIPVTDFWKYYNDTLYPMAPADKISLMNS
jgi:hypothetical protein